MPELTALVWLGEPGVPLVDYPGASPECAGTAERRQNPPRPGTNSVRPRRKPSSWSVLGRCDHRRDSPDRIVGGFKTRKRHRLCEVCAACHARTAVADRHDQHVRRARRRRGPQTNGFGGRSARQRPEPPLGAVTLDRLEGRVCADRPDQTAIAERTDSAVSPYGVTEVCLGAHRLRASDPAHPASRAGGGPLMWARRTVAAPTFAARTSRPVQRSTSRHP